MPADERLRFDHGEEATPFEDARQANEDDARGVVGATRLHSPFHVQRQLLSQEKVFGGQLGT